MNTPKGNWTRTPRLSSEELHARAVARLHAKQRYVAALRLAGVKGVGIETHKPPHAPRGTAPRLHRNRDAVERIRMFPGSGPVSRLSMVCHV